MSRVKIQIAFNPYSLSQVLFVIDCRNCTAYFDLISEFTAFDYFYFHFVHFCLWKIHSLTIRNCAVMRVR